MRIGLLQAGHLAEEMQIVTGDYPELYGRLLEPEGMTIEPFPVVDGIFPNSVEDAEGWLISGSRHGAYEDHPWIAPLEDFIRDIRADGRPLVGICFGHQIVAQALGGRVEKYSGGWIAGRQTYNWDGRVVPLNAWHQDQVVAVPEGARVAGSGPSCVNAFIEYGPGILTMQPHPEFDRKATETLLDVRGRTMLPADIEAGARATLDDPTDERLAARSIAEFYRNGGGHGRVA